MADSSSSSWMTPGKSAQRRLSGRSSVGRVAAAGTSIVMTGGGFLTSTPADVEAAVDIVEVEEATMVMIVEFSRWFVAGDNPAFVAADRTGTVELEVCVLRREDREDLMPVFNIKFFLFVFLFLLLLVVLLMCWWLCVVSVVWW